LTWYKNGKQCFLPGCASDLLASRLKKAACWAGIDIKQGGTKWLIPNLKCSHRTASRVFLRQVARQKIPISQAIAKAAKGRSNF